MSAPLSDFQVTWSLYAEGEALRHQKWAATPINVLRQRHGWTLVPDGELPEPLVDTDPKDMPILSAATLAGAKFVVTENIADFGRQDIGTTSPISRSPRPVPVTASNRNGVPANPRRSSRNPKQRTEDRRRNSQRRGRRIPATPRHDNTHSVSDSPDSPSPKSAQAFVSRIPLRRLRATAHQPFKPRERYRAGVP